MFFGLGLRDMVLCGLWCRASGRPSIRASRRRADRRRRRGAVVAVRSERTSAGGFSSPVACFRASKRARRARRVRRLGRARTLIGVSAFPRRLTTARAWGQSTPRATTRREPGARARVRATRVFACVLYAVAVRRARAVGGAVGWLCRVA